MHGSGKCYMSQIAVYRNRLRRLAGRRFYVYFSATACLFRVFSRKHRKQNGGAATRANCPPAAASHSSPATSSPSGWSLLLHEAFQPFFRSILSTWKARRGAHSLTASVPIKVMLLPCLFLGRLPACLHRSLRAAAEHVWGHNDRSVRWEDFFFCCWNRHVTSPPLFLFCFILFF